MTKQRKPTDLQAKILQRLCDGYLMVFGVGTQNARLENRDGDKLHTCYSTIYRMRKLGWIDLGTITDAGRAALRGDAEPLP